MEVLALDGWTGVAAGKTSESLELLTIDNSDSTNKTVAAEAARADLAKPANPQGTADTSEQNVPLGVNMPVFMNSAGGAHSEYTLSLQQARDGRDLEGRATCNSSPCSGDSILYVGLDHLPRAALRIELKRKSSAAAYPIEQRLGIRNITVEPSHGYPRCSIKYQFRDANLQSAYYCLVLEARTRCGVNNSGDLRCDVNPTLTSSSESGIGFFPVSQSQKCFCKRYDSAAPFGVIDSSDACCIPEDTNNNGVYDAGDTCATNSTP